jgi:hypothetical protein
MLGGYLLAIYGNKLKSTAYKPIWVVTGLIGLLIMIIMSQHIFFGITKIPSSGTINRNHAGNPEKQKGYKQRLKVISLRRKGLSRSYFEIVGEYIHRRSEPKDKIYVWGWVPGIYMKAQRLSPTPKAFEGTMHTLSPEVLSERVDEILGAFEKEPPKFIVDTRKRHFPWDRPPLELWPVVWEGVLGAKSSGFLPLDKKMITAYNKVWSDMLRRSFGQDEAERYKAMAPFRKFVMDNYRIVELRQYVTKTGWPWLRHMMFDENVLFERKNTQQMQPPG